MAEAQANADNTFQRRRSIFDRFRNRNKYHSEGGDESTLTDGESCKDDDISTFTSNTINSRMPLFGRRKFKDDDNANKASTKTEKRESMSDRGAFRIESTPGGVPIAIENKDWPPGVSYKTSSQMKQLKNADGSGGMGPFYEGQGSIAPGGENAANSGPDPDWVPGLSEAERAKLRSDKSGRYVF